jgi:PAS domain S-box-containing protein
MKKADQLRPHSRLSADSGLGQDLSRLANSIESVTPDNNLLEAVARKTAAQAAATLPPEPERFLASLLSRLPETIYRCANDRNWTMEFLSETCRQLTGYEPEDLIQNRRASFADLIHPEDRERVWSSIQQAVAQGQPYRLQYRILVPTGATPEEKWIREEGAAILSPSGQPLALEGSLLDISKQKQMEETIQRLRREVSQLNLELRRQDQDIEAFSFMSAHTLREPLRHLVLFSQLLEKHAGSSLSPLAKGHIGAIMRAAGRMEHRIADVQSLVFATRISMLRETVRLAECAEAALESLRAAAERAEAHIEVDALPEVIGDPILLTRLFEHLLGNALRFGGPKPSIQITARLNESRWVFGVKDNGPGIDPRYHSRIFRPFERLHSSRTNVGNGMGLAICQSIVQRHEGKLWLWSELGKGAHFQFLLGLKPEPLNPVTG